MPARIAAPGGGGRAAVVPGVVRAGHQPVQVARPVAGVRAVPWHAAGLPFPVHDEDVGYAERAQFERGGQTGRPGADDEDVGLMPAVQLR